MSIGRDERLPSDDELFAFEEAVRAEQARARKITSIAEGQTGAVRREGKRRKARKQARQSRKKNR